MKCGIIAAWAAGTVMLGLFLYPAMQAGAEDAPSFKDQKGKVSYGIGVGVARDFKQRGVEIDPDEFMSGLRDALLGGKLRLSESDLSATMNAYEKELQSKREHTEKVLAEENKKEGAAFLAANAKKEDVITLGSGLQYRVVREGTGKKPVLSDAVAIKYRGTLINGREFDRSRIPDQPAVFKVESVLPGLKEALLLMNTGSAWQIFIPSQLAYGERRVREIGPNAVLLFDVELVAIVKPEEPKTEIGVEKESKRSPDNSR